MARRTFVTAPALLGRTEDGRRSATHGAVSIHSERPLVVRDTLASIVHESPTAIAVFRRDRTVGYRNPAWDRIVGVDDPVTDDGPDPIELALELGQGSSSEERGIRRPDGTESRILLSVIPITADGDSPVGAIAYGEPLDRAAAGTLREAFLGVLSHELRTPITSIYGGSQLLLQDALSADSRAEVLETIAIEAEQLHRRVEDFLALARVERGMDAPLREPISLRRSIASVVTAEQRRSPGQRFMVTAEKALPLAVGDDAQVRQVLHNLISIATDVSPPGRPIVIATTSTDVAVEVSIKDRGPKVDRASPDDPEADLFSLSYRRPAAGGHVPRSGLGLYVARTLVEANGGRIWLRPRRGGGTETGFALPTYETVQE
ncbi:MAG: histidine kinase dimerization/phospho-acceptor domain-containing protein [Candidatus Limnocylindrales bacterium]